jgi:hypothetical protein
VKDPCIFLDNLSRLLPQGSVLYFEGTTEREVDIFLSGRPATGPVKVRMGTIWPRPLVYHMPFTHSNVQGLARLLRTRHIPYLCTHPHSYKNGRMLLWWHDAFEDRTMLISCDIAEDKVADFADSIGSKYRLIEHIS